MGIDKNISKHFISKIKRSLKKKKLYIHFFKANEMNKNFNSANKILDILLNKNFSREDCVISIGGGITGDVSGFVASLFKRGEERRGEQSRGEQRKAAERRGQQRRGEERR